ncbi:hypothetical protein TWF506_005960 [Arthrobotrys conoides]|uniref:CBM6 domain-containing protein n=1 Tax=Arthrobotrys conoides TaxID=74498 RepID=A0AAN8NCY9_9PEZI
MTKLFRCLINLHILLLLDATNHAITSVRADNPIIQTIYTSDPAPIIYNNRLYVFVSHDEDGSKVFTQKDWRLFSTTDMANWQDHGIPMSLETFDWADRDAWAGHVVHRNNKFYYYVPIHRRGGDMAIGVGVSDNIEGPFKDALGKPLVENGAIDPDVYIDDDGQAYLYWSNPGLWYLQLNSDMVSYSGNPTQINLTTEAFGTRSSTRVSSTGFQEGGWIYKRNGTIYFVYASHCCPESIAYSVGSGPLGPWTYKGVIMTQGPGSFTNHPGVIDYKNNSYFFYHNGALPGGSEWTRSVSVERFEYNSDGSIPQTEQTLMGPPQLETLDPYIRQEAETMAFSSGLKTQVSSNGGIDVTSIENGDYIKLKGVDFGSGAKSLVVCVASKDTGSRIEVRLASKEGILIGVCDISQTGDLQTWGFDRRDISGATGVQDLFFLFKGGNGLLFNFDWWQFNQ